MSTSTSRGPLIVTAVGAAVVSAAVVAVVLTLSDGPVPAAWGSDQDGLLGVGGAGGVQATPLPLQMPHETVYVQVAAGDGFSCGADQHGGLWCWGRGQHGQLGDGQGRTSAAPVEVVVPDGFGAAEQVVAGTRHACARSAGGQLACWGHNGHGQVGDGTTGQATVARLVDGGPWVDVDAGGSHTCAVDVAGGGFCWGEGGGQQQNRLGIGSTSGATVPTPLVMPEGRSVAAVAAGGEWHSAAIDPEGRVYVWGWGRAGQLGDTGTSATVVPVEMPLPAGMVATQISAGADHTCIVDQHGDVFCWGRGTDGQLGGGVAADSPQLVHVRVPDGVAAATLDVGDDHACIVDVAGDVWCWGAGDDGRLGTGTSTSESVPVLVDLPWDAAGVTAGAAHTVAWPAP